jgi:sulfatase maturation enzyme AslB (radical SAM superfamily)
MGSNKTITIKEKKFSLERRLSKQRCDIGLNLTYMCNNRCIFCYDSAKRTNLNNLPFSEAKNEILILKSRGINLISLRGSEPTLYPYIFELIGFIKENNLRFRMTTNARFFSYEKNAENFARMGLDNVYTSIHSANPMVHDRLTLSPGSFKQSIMGIDNLIDKGVRVETNTTILKQNVKELPEIANFLSTRFNKIYRARFSFLYTEGCDLSVKEWKKMMPSLVETRKYVTKAMGIFRKKGIYSFIEKMPICGSPKYSLDFKSEDYVIKDNIKPKKCSKCKYYIDNYCVGLSKTYIKIYGTKGIKPI